MTSAEEPRTMIPIRTSISRRTRGSILLLSLLLAAVLATTFEAGVAGAVPMTFTVTNTDDSGTGSLRQAISDANANTNPADVDAIEFEIPTATDSGCDATSGVCTISPTSALPSVTEAVKMDGYTQQGASANTLATGNDAQLKVELSGASAGSDANGIRIASSDSAVKGLIINRWDNDGVQVSGSSASGNTIEGNFIGTDASGTQDLGNSEDGVEINGAPDNTVGGTSASARNVISGNTDVGVGIDSSGASGNRIEGNYIGTDADGTASLGNFAGGVQIDGAPDNVLGGTSASARNVISANDDNGVYVGGGSSASGNQIAGNYVGTDVNGTADLGNTDDGVEINNAPNNTVGGTDAGAGNLLSANDQRGVFIDGPSASGNEIQGNLIGTDESGTADLGNSRDGVEINNAPNNTVGGTDAGAGNTISGNSNGVYITNSTASGNTIQGNYVGTDEGGTADLGNRGYGVFISRAPNNTIGGTTAAARNVISGNGYGVGVDSSGASGNTIEGNYIGTDETGTQDLGNDGDGVEIFAASDTAVGGTDPGAGNLVSGNGDNGVYLLNSDTTGTLIQGNFIGTDETGTQDLGNAEDGVEINGAPNNTVGGTSASARNVISGNEYGVYVTGSGASGNRIEGNYIGTDETGTADLGNDLDGVNFEGAPDNVLGGTSAAARNVVSGNGQNGVLLDQGASGSTVAGNYIGTDASGTADLGNESDGVDIDVAQNNTVGGTSAAARNIVANNGQNGVLVFGIAATGNSILRNSIFQNAELGIDLGGGGATTNDPQDPDTGPNNLQNYPTITSAKTSATATTISATLNSNPNEGFTIQFFSNLPAENEGRTFIGQQSVSTNANGDASTTFSPTGNVPTGRTITATATRSSTGDTSEFSAARTVTDGTPPSVVRVVPAENATNQNLATNVTAFFSEDMRPASINQNTFYLREAGETAKVSATLTYDVPTKRAILNPAAPLEQGTTYVATVTSGARDLAGNQLDQDPGTPGNQSKIWRFTTRP